MKLVPVISPGMQLAHSSSYVTTTVDILLQDRDLLRPISRLLKKHYSSASKDLAKDLEAFRLNRSRPDESGNVVTPEHVIILTQLLHNLYVQRDQTRINYQRGAIVELLVLKLIRHRYNADDFCANNQRFVEDFKDITVKEVDVAALSKTSNQVEGYECKVSASGFAPYDCINLKDLVSAAEERRYMVNVGFVCLDNDSLMRIKLKHLQPFEPIKLYGLDSLETLEAFSFNA